MPNRIIKESILTSPNFNCLSVEAERHFYRLLLIADDYGCFEATPPVVKGKCYPYQDHILAKDIDDWQRELSTGKIIIYWEEEDGRIYGVFVNWEKHNTKYSVTADGKPTRHRRRTPEPPKGIFCQPLPAFANLADSCQNLPYNPNPNPNPNPDLERKESIDHSLKENDPSVSESISQNSTTVTTLTPRKVVELYNELCPKLSKVTALTQKRKDKIVVRLKEFPDEAFWRNVFETANNTPFLCGNNKNNWKATFDWLITNDTNAVRVVEGAYKSEKHSGLRSWAEKMGSKQYQEPGHT